MENIKDLKAKYNKALELLHRADKYFEDKSIPMEEKEKQIPNMIKIVNALNTALNHLQEQGVYETPIDRGFEI